jgi:hypothetical protein
MNIEYLKLEVIGDISKLPEKSQAVLHNVINKTKNHS